MFVYINSTDRTSDVILNTLQITDDLREKPNSATFNLKGVSPSYFQDVEMYAGYYILSATANSVTLNAIYRLNDNNLFRTRDIIHVAIGLADQESAEVLTVSEDGGKIKLTMTANFASTPAATEQCGRREFAGSVVDIKDKNIGGLTNIEYSISCLDWTRIFDKELANKTYVDKDVRYIINDICNATINLNQAIDDMQYVDNAAIQAEWIESGDGTNPTVDTTSPFEGTTWGKMNWTFSAGTATFSATPVSSDISVYVGASSGTPIKGVYGFWYKLTDYTKVTNIRFRLGSDSSNYVLWTIVPTSNEETFVPLDFADATKTGTPVWTACDYAAIIVTETASSSAYFTGFRVLEDEYFKHSPFVDTTITFDDFRIDRIKPTEVLQRLADELGWYWYIDYDRYIHFFNRETNVAPFNIDETSDNFDNLSISSDTTRLVNRQVVKGGDEVSTAIYSQVFVGNGFTREWILKNKFKNLVIKVDNNTSTDTCEAGTNTTNIKATAHGLATGDYIINRTRSNAVREITRVDPDNFTVTTVTGQTTGDTFSKFIAKNVGVEGLDDEAAEDYMSNYNEKSIRSAETEATLISTEYLLAQYNEVFPIFVQRSDWVSIGNLRTVLGHTNGIFDGQPIIDRTLKTRSEAVQVANATLLKYSNTVITALFTTWENGLSSGQIITIKDTANGTRNINQDFVIQQVKIREVEWGHFQYSVTCSSLLFGMLELLIQLLKRGRQLDVEADAQIAFIEDVRETITITVVVTSSVDGNKQVEAVGISESTSSYNFTPPYKYEVTGLSNSRYNLASYS